MHGCSWTHHVLLLLAILALPLAAAQPWARCDSKSGNYSEGGTYEANLVNLVDTLRRKAPFSASLFASNTSGGVYGLMLCRGDVSPTDCADCGTNARRDARTACGGRSKDVALCYNQCYIRLSDKNFLTSTENSGEIRLYNSANISSSDVTGYKQAVTSLLLATVQYAVDNSTRLFATGEWIGSDPGFPHIYSAAQCAADLSPVQCQTCLNGLMGEWWKTFEWNVLGARIAGTRCTLRSEVGTVPFYAGGAMLLLPTKAAAAPGPTATAEPPDSTEVKNKGTRLLGIILPVLGVAVTAAISLCVWNSIRRKRRSRRPTVSSQSHSVDDLEVVNSSLMSLSSLQRATNNFDESNKLGEGGFGIVYKGILSGQEVAVKRLSKGSNQGLQEVKNELVLVANLHHKNLVRLVGFSFEAGERLLVYEYMPNKSLDTILFDPEEKHRLYWAIRYKIIEGVARGLQYLHEDSQTKIVHRDLKVSNVLLDVDMTPKIGDFGLARLFREDQTREVTDRIIGTFGYMSPEYAMRGQFSTKSDVYSFGVLVIEIVTGRVRNIRSYHSEETEDLMSIVWRHWGEGTIAEMVDYSLGTNYPGAEVLKCVHIGLLCLQQNPVDRPTMSDIMVILNSNTTSSLPAVAKPAVLLDGSSYFDSRSSTDTLISVR